MKKILFLLPLLFGALTFVGCSDDDPKPTAFTLKASKEQLTLKVGETAALAVTGHPAGATVVWSSENPQVATVAATPAAAQSGSTPRLAATITAKSVGTTRIVATVTRDGISARAVCTVEVQSGKLFVAFADANLKKQILDLPGVDADKDGEISPDEAAAVKKLVLNFERKEDATPDKVIAKLAGLESFVNLDTLDLKNQSVTDAAVIARLTKLTYLHLGNNDIPSLDLRALTALKDLRLYGNARLTSLDLSANTALEQLYLQDTGLTGLDLTPLKALRQAVINRAKLRNIKFSGLPLLERIDLVGNELASLSATDLPELREIHANGNAIASVTLKNLPELQRLNLYENQLTAFRAELPKLMFLFLMNNQLTSADFSKLPLLLQCFISANPIQELDFSQNQHIRALEANEMPNLTTINLKNGGYNEEAEYDFASGNPKLKTIVCDAGDEVNHIKNVTKNLKDVSVVTQ